MITNKTPEIIFAQTVSKIHKLRPGVTRFALIARFCWDSLSILCAQAVGNVLNTQGCFETVVPKHRLHQPPDFSAKIGLSFFAVIKEPSSLSQLTLHQLQSILLELFACQVYLWHYLRQAPRTTAVSYSGFSGEDDESSRRFIWIQLLGICTARGTKQFFMATPFKKHNFFVFITGALGGISICLFVLWFLVIKLGNHELVLHWIGIISRFQLKFITRDSIC